VKQQVCQLDQTTWTADFISKCFDLHKQREQEWANSWQSKCSGKQFLIDLRQECVLKAGMPSLKRRLLQESQLYQGGGTEGWKLLNAMVKSILKI
jgi:hypothetical protein